MLARNEDLYRLYRKQVRAIEDEMTEAARKSATMEAEIVPTTCARWYLVQTFPLEEVRAMRWLARRRFGVFQPVEQRIHHGVLVQGWQAIFPGWLLVYTWDIDRMQGRITSTPGVMDLFRYPVSLAPVPIPKDFVQMLRERAFDYRESAPRRSSVGFHSERHVRRRTPRPNKKQRKELDRLKKQARDSGIGWDQHTWDNINSLAPHERIALLQRTLTQNQPAVVG